MKWQQPTHANDCGCPHVPYSAHTYAAVDLVDSDTPHGAVVIVVPLSVGLPHEHLAAWRSIRLFWREEALAIVLPEHHAPEHNLLGLGALVCAVFATLADRVIAQGEFTVV